MDKNDKGQTQATMLFLCLCCTLYGLCLSFVFFVYCIAGFCPLSFLSIVWPERQRTSTGNTMYKKDEGQTPAIQWTRKTKEKHRPYNGQKRQRTSTGNAMYKKDNCLCLSFVFLVHFVACVCSLSFLSILLPVFVLCLFCPLYGLCLSFVFFVHCMAGVGPLSFLSIVWPVFTKDKHRQCNVQKRQRINTGNTMDKKDKGQTQAIQ
jgi:hypothetical protein